ncbi:MAG: glycosyltransferase family 2 protein [Verrucomicrobiota bacterium]
MHRNYAEANLGCRARISSGLTWAFGLVEEAIILEDDCYPDPSFFPYAAEMLARYRHDPRVMHVSGSNIVDSLYRPAASYWFSRHPWIWGWATWRRAWQHYDYQMETWAQRKAALDASFATSWERAFWVSAYDHARQHPTQVNTWDFSWVYTCRSLGGLCIFPRENLIENLGFGGDSTHTSDNMQRLRKPTRTLTVSEHPKDFSVDHYADDLVTRQYAGTSTSLWANIQARLRVWRNRSKACLN